MKLRSLESFCAAIEEGSISGAARRIYLSQPSVSERLTELEHEARVPLLDRSQYGVTPTTQGAILYEHARRILDDMEGIERTIHVLRNEHENNLRLGACLTLGEHLLPEWLRDFTKETPNIIPKLLMGNNQEAVQAAKNADIAIGLVAIEPNLEPLNVIPLLEDEYVVVVPPEHPWAHRPITARDVSQGPFIAREKESKTRGIVERVLTEMGEFPMNDQMELGSINAIKEAIETGLGFSVLSRAAVRKEIQAGTLAIAHGFAIPVDYGIVWLPSTIFSKVERAFCEYLRKQAAKVPRYESSVLKQ